MLVRSLTLVFLFSATFAVAQDKPVDPALPKCPPGWRVEVVKQTPEIKHPSVVCATPDGRIFMAEDPMDMGADSKKPTDRILCFHPDGKTTVFAENLHAVFGLQYIDGKLYVHHVPKFSVFVDDNGIGKNRIDLIECTNPNPAPGFNDHIPANCRLGMDGYLYVSVGDKGLFGAVGTDGKKAEIFGGGVFRIRPDGTDLEVHSTGTRNHLDVALNSEDEIFTYDNTDDGHGWWTRVTHMVDGGFYGYPWNYKPQRPHTLWMMTDYGGGSPTGAMAYNEDALPPEYQGNLFLCEWGRKQLLRLTVAREGGTYKIVNREDFLTGGSVEFRPVGIAVAPDGKSFYVTDWNFGGWKQDKPAGRLLKVTYTGKTNETPQPAWYLPAAMGKKSTATTADLVAGLSHPAQSVRLVAQRRLAELGQAAVAQVAAVLADKNAPATAKWSAIWTLDAMDQGVAGRAAIRSALHADEASVKRQAAKQLGTRKATEAVPELVALLSDTDTSVRFSAATALGRIGSSQAVAPLLGKLEEPDLFTRYAYFTALNRIGRADPQAWAGLIAGLESSNPRVREGALFALRETWEPGVITTLAKVVPNAQVPAETRAAALLTLSDLARKAKPWDGKWWGTQPIKSPRPTRNIDWEGTEAAVAALKGAVSDPQPQVALAAIEGLLAVQDHTHAAAVRTVFKSAQDIPLRCSAVRYLAAAKDPTTDAEVVALLSKLDTAPPLVLEAVAAASANPTDASRAALVELSAKATDTAVLVKTLEALAVLKLGKPETLVQHVKHTDASVRQAALAALAASGDESVLKDILPLLEEKSVDVRRAAIAALGALQARAAVPQLMKAYTKKETQFEAAQALAEMPDRRALDAYLEGLSSKNATLRKTCSEAVAALGSEVLPDIESKLDSTLIGPDAVSELQKIYSRALPVVEWKILGPFERKAAVPFPVAAVPLEAEFKSSQGKTIRWQTVKADQPATGLVDLLKHMPQRNDCSAYGYVEFDSPTARDVEFIAGSDDGTTLWLNGQQLLDDQTDHGYNATQYKVKGKLKEGKNALLVRVAQGGADWCFSVAIPAPQKGRLFEMKPKKLDPRVYASFAESNAGNAEHGKELFADLKGVACIKCHKVRGTGGEIGPDLQSVGAKYNRSQLIESVLYPSKQILDGYRQTVIVTDSGTVRSGLVKTETDAAITLVDAEGKQHVIPKDSIDDQLKSNQSLMPDGLNSGLTVQDLADLITYLETLKEKPATPSPK